MTKNPEIKGGLERRKTSRFWYGRFTDIDGRRTVKNLHVEVRGTPPGPHEEYGSVPYEKSRTEASAALKVMLSEINGKKTAEDLAQTVHQIRTGRRVDQHQLKDLPVLWEKHSKTASQGHKTRSLGRIHDFVEWMQDNYPNIKRLDQLNSEHAETFLESQEKRGITPRTWNFVMSTMKTACKRGQCNAFDGIKQKPLETVHRVPFSPEELRLVLKAASTDELLYPLVVTAACTAMRKGDCCRLSWDAVDLETGFITVKTSKTGRTIDIPMADLLRTEIEKQCNNGSQYVFPQLAARYMRDDSYLTKRFKHILAKAGFHDGKIPSIEPPEYDQDELKLKAAQYFDQIPTTKKWMKAKTVFTHYIGGKRLCDAAELAGVSKSTASAYLNEVETSTGIRFIRGKRRNSGHLPPSLGPVSKDRSRGLRRASIRDFHALRTTWITLALMQGMPLELVKKVTGHATAEIVMENYFRPQREELRNAMQKALPGFLSSSTDPATNIATAADLLRTINSKNWNKVSTEALQLLEMEINGS